MGENTSHTRHSNSQTHEPSFQRRLIRAFAARALANRSFVEKIADSISSDVGSIPFLVINGLWFTVWIILNIEAIPGIEPFDPYPFGLLTMIVSLEAIILSIFVLLSQNRAARVAEIREELDLQVNLIAEKEITKVLEVVADIREKVGIKKEDPELIKMLERIDTSYIQRSIEKQISSGESGLLDFLNTPILQGNQEKSSKD